MAELFLTPTAKDRALPIYLTSVGHRAQEPVHRARGLPDFQWLHTVRGEGYVEFGRERGYVTEGRGFLMAPRVRHRYWACTPEWETMWFTFNGARVDAFLRAWHLNPSFIQLKDGRHLGRLIRNVLEHRPTSTPEYSLELSQLLYLCLGELVRQVSLEPRMIRNRERIQPALDYIEVNFQSPITLNDLAELLRLTPQHVCRLFKRTLGTSPIRYITSVRIRKAKQYLIDTPEISIAAIARHVGFSDPSYFCAVFKKHEQMTPSESRGRIRPSVASAGAFALDARGPEAAYPSRSAITNPRTWP